MFSHIQHDIRIHSIFQHWTPELARGHCEQAVFGKYTPIVCLSWSMISIDGISSTEHK